MDPRPFLVNVGALRHRHGAPGSAHDMHAARRGPLPGLAVSSARVPDHADVAIDAVLEMASGTSILVTGTVTAPWEGECRRCLQPARGALAATVRELFEDKPTPDETYKLGGDQLDLEPLVRDAVLLELPQAPLCMEACAGLCPICGVNRNEGSCTCDTNLTDPRWAALDALRAPEA